MKNRFFLSFLISLLALSACNVTKNLPDGEQLYTGAELNIERDGAIPQRQELYAKLNDKVIPQPNKKFLGLAYTRLWFRQNIREPKKKKGLRNWLKNKIGKAPVLYSSVNPNQVVLFLKKQLQDRGHFHPKIDFEEIKKGRKVSLVYNLSIQQPYRIRKVIPPTPKQPIDSLIHVFYKQEKLKKEAGNTYSLDYWDQKRDELSTFIRNQGYYNFTKRYIYFYVDTALKSREVDLHLRSTTAKDSTVFNQYYIRDITVNAAYRLEGNKALEAENYNGIDYFQDIEYVKPKALAPFITIKEGDVYSQKNHSYTLNQLLDLNIFKFVNIQYSKVSGDSLDVKILLTPTQYQDVEVNLEASTTNTNFLGTNVQVRYLNRHLFKRAHQLELLFNVGTEIQFGGTKSNTNILDINGQISYYLPKLLGFAGWQKRRQIRNPKTRFSFTNNYEKWFELYALNSAEFSFAYDWVGNNNWRQSLSPFTFTRVNLLQSDTELDDLLNSNPILRSSFEEVMIFSQKYSFQFDTKDPDRPLKEYWWVNTKLETAGNFLYGIFSGVKSAEKPYTLLNVPFSQYALIDFDARHYWIINEKNVFVTRFNGGLGVSYGNSNSMPYVKQFYLGGPSTLRAFRFRGIGPGTYINDTDDFVNSIDQAGDVKLLLNLEYRFTIYRYLKAALFADIGNIWLLREDVDRPGGTFYFNEFYRQLAIGSGLGIRLDFDIFVIRLDVGVPLRKPYLDPGKEWINNFTESSWRDWRKNNLVWNIAIGYPF